MHGKAREEYKAKMRDPTIGAMLQQKAEQWHQLVQEIAKRRPTSSHSSTSSMNDEATTATTTMALLEKALLVNPDPLYLWNHRREWILLLQQSTNATDANTTATTNATSTTASSVLETELSLTQAALKRNPKAYGAWMHRKWILQYAALDNTEILQSELALTVQFLALDERNFHCWNYRRFVVGCLANAATTTTTTTTLDYHGTGKWEEPKMGIQIVPNKNGCYKENQTAIPDARAVPMPSDDLLQAEWDFTSQKIKDNYSNFSAFHYRSQLLGRMLQMHEKRNNNNNSCNDLWVGELSLIEDAICTEPDDQTAWWYHALLLSSSSASQEESTQVVVFPIMELKDRLEEHLNLLRELLQEAPTNKWILLGIHRVLDRLGSSTTTTTPHTEMSQNHVVKEQRTILETLQSVDPDRSQRYQELLEQLA